MDTDKNQISRTNIKTQVSALTRHFPSPYEMPTEWSAGLQPAGDRRARKAGYKPALRLDACEIFGLRPNQTSALSFLICVHPCLQTE